MRRIHLLLVIVTAFNAGRSTFAQWECGMWAGQIFVTEVDDPCAANPSFLIIGEGQFSSCCGGPGCWPSVIIKNLTKNTETFIDVGGCGGEDVTYMATLSAAPPQYSVGDHLEFVRANRSLSSQPAPCDSSGPTVTVSPKIADQDDDTDGILNCADACPDEGLGIHAQTLINGCWMFCIEVGPNGCCARRQPLGGFCVPPHDPPDGMIFREVSSPTFAEENEYGTLGVSGAAFTSSVGTFSSAEQSVLAIANTNGDDLIFSVSGVAAPRNLNLTIDGGKSSWRLEDSSEISLFAGEAKGVLPEGSSLVVTYQGLQGVDSMNSTDLTIAGLVGGKPYSGFGEIVVPESATISVWVALNYDISSETTVDDAKLRLLKFDAEAEKFVLPGTRNVGTSQGDGSVGTYGLNRDAQEVWAIVSESGTFVVGDPDSNDQQDDSPAVMPRPAGGICGVGLVPLIGLSVLGLSCVRRRTVVSRVGRRQTATSRSWVS